MLLITECDRSFTRSDALTKHVRQVHEAEPLRPSDAPAPRSGGNAAAANKPPRIKLKVTQPPKDSSDAEQHQQQGGNAGGGASSELGNSDQINIHEYGPEIGLDAHDISLPPAELYRLLRRQIYWAEQEGTELRDEWNRIEPRRKQAWREKEAIFNDMLDAELRFFNAAAAARKSGDTDNSDDGADVEDDDNQAEDTNSKVNGLKQEKEEDAKSGNEITA